MKYWDLTAKGRYAKFWGLSLLFSIIMSVTGAISLCFARLLIIVNQELQKTFVSSLQN